MSGGLLYSCWCGRHRVSVSLLKFTATWPRAVVTWHLIQFPDLVRPLCCLSVVVIVCRTCYWCQRQLGISEPELEPSARQGRRQYREGTEGELQPEDVRRVVERIRGRRSERRGRVLKGKQHFDRHRFEQQQDFSQGGGGYRERHPSQQYIEDPEVWQKYQPHCPPLQFGMIPTYVK